MAKGLEHLDDLHNLTLSPFVLMKESAVIDTITKLRGYLGPKVVSDPKVGEGWHSDAHKIRLKAGEIFKKFESNWEAREKNQG
jgi:hypothetical protein